MADAEMDERARALEQIAGLARQHQLSAAEIAAALGGMAAAPVERRGRNVLVRVLGFLGATFVFAGIGVFVALQWDGMNSAARVIVTLGSGLAVLVMGVLSARGVRFDKATAPLLLVAAALEPTGMLVAFDEYGTGGDWHWASLITCAVMALQFSAVFASIEPHSISTTASTAIATTTPR